MHRFVTLLNIDRIQANGIREIRSSSRLNHYSTCILTAYRIIYSCLHREFWNVPHHGGYLFIYLFIYLWFTE